MKQLTNPQKYIALCIVCVTCQREQAAELSLVYLLTIIYNTESADLCLYNLFWFNTISVFFWPEVFFNIKTCKTQI